MKKGKKLLLSGSKLAAFLLLCILMLTGLTLLLARKESFNKYKPFYDSEQNFDVLFFGTSHGCNGFAPLELWDSYGIASYNLSQHSEYMPITYYQVLNALEHTNPRLVVIDPYLIAAPDKIPGDRTTWSYLHDSLDAMPLSAIKLQAIHDLLPDFDSRFEFLWNYTIYHNRWRELSEQDYKPRYNIEKGSESRIGNLRLADLTLLPDGQYTDLTGTVGLSYLDKMIEECHSRNIEVLLVYLPYQADSSSQMIAGGIQTYAEEKGVLFENLLQKKLINYSTDMYDAGHLNPSGYKKVADYLGPYIKEHFDIPDRREDEAYYSWYDDYEAYATMQIENLLSAEDFYVYLTLLQNKNISFTISINGASSFLANAYVAPYLYNLGITADLSSVSDEEVNFFAVVDRMDNTVTEFVNEDHIELYPSFGQVLYDCDENGVQTFQIGTEIYHGTEAEHYIHITAINNRTGQVIDNITYYENVHYEYFRYED